jgi:hypothetical protein
MNRRLWAISAITLLAQSVAPHAQEVSPEIDRAAREGKAAFECAILAAEGSDAINASASPLAHMGHDQSLLAMQAIMDALMANMESSGGPLGPYMLEQDATFFVALGFAEASKKIETFLNEVAPFDGSASYETLRTMRDIQADLEFGRRNCALLLP